TLFLMTFRSLLLSFAAVALALTSFTYPAMGQITPPPPPPPPTSPVCRAQAAVTPGMRSQGLTELAGSIAIVCQALPVTSQGVPWDGNRIYRISSMRLNAASVAAGSNSAPIPVTATLTFSNGVSIDQGTNLPVGYVVPAVDFSLRSPDSTTNASSTGFGVSECTAPQHIGTFRVYSDGPMTRRSFALYVDSET